MGVDLRNDTVAVEMKPGQRIDEAAFRTEMKGVGYNVVSVEQVAMAAAQIPVGDCKRASPAVQICCPLGRRGCQMRLRASVAEFV